MSNDITLTCRICLEEESNVSTLINPCRCDGTSKYVHIKCINEWIETTLNREAKKQCMECKTYYIFKSNNQEKTSIYFCVKKKLPDIYLKHFFALIPLSVLTFTYDLSNNNFYLIKLIFFKDSTDIIIGFFKNNFFWGVNYYYYIYNYLFFCFFIFLYVISVCKNVRLKYKYIKKASNLYIGIITYIFLFFWYNAIINFILDINVIVLVNSLNNILSPHAIYYIIDKHDEIIKKISETNILLPYQDGNDSDTDSETGLLNIEIE